MNPNACPTPGCGGRKRRERAVCGACWRALAPRDRLALRLAGRRGDARGVAVLLRAAAAARVRAGLEGRA